MGMFGDLMGKIFRHGANAERPHDAGPAQPAPRPGIGVGGGSGSMGGGRPAGVATEVDVEAILNKLAASHGEKLNWKTSIVDLMKLVGMDSSLSERKELAKDLNYSGNTDDSAAMNIWLHKEVMKKLAANGGRVPADLLSH